MTAVRQAKYKIGDILKVIKRAPYLDKGSCKRTDFVVKEITWSHIHKDYVYWPDDNKQGAFECQLQPDKITDWKNELG